MVSKRVPIWVFLIGPIVTAAFFVSMAVPGLLHPPDFSLSSSSTTLFAESYRYGSSSFLFNSYHDITLNSLNGFTGVLSVQIDAPAILHACCNSSNIPLSTNASFVWAVNPSGVGNETVRITARSGSLAHSIFVTVMVEAVDISFNPSPITIPISTSGGPTMTLTSLNGPTGNITLTGGYNDHVGTISFTKSSVILPIDGTVSTTVNVSSAYKGTWELPYMLSGAIFPPWTYQYPYNGFVNVTFT